MPTSLLPQTDNDMEIVQRDDWKDGDGHSANMQQKTKKMPAKKYQKNDNDEREYQNTRSRTRQNAAPAKKERRAKTQNVK